MISRTNPRTFPRCKMLLALPLFVLSLAPAARAQQKDARAIVAAATANELKSDQEDHTAFIYRDHDVVPGKDTTFLVVQTPEGNLRRKLEDHGRPLTSEDRQADDARIQALLRDSALQKKLKRDSSHDDEQAEEMLKLLPTAFLWSIVGEKGDLITLAFKRDPGYDASGMEAKVFASMEGEIVVAQSERRIRSMKGQMMNDVKIAGGLFGGLHKGGTFQVEHREVTPHHWQLTELHVHIAGKVFFATIGSQEDEIMSDFKPSPAMTLQQASDLAARTQ